MKTATKQKLPRGWNEKKIRALIAYYDNQTDEEGAAEIEAALTAEGQTMMSVPTELVPKIAWLIAQHQERPSNGRPGTRKTPRMLAKNGRRTPVKKEGTASSSSRPTR